MSTGSTPNPTTTQPAPSSPAPTTTQPAPAHADLLHRLFSGAQADAAAVGTAISNSVQAIESGSLFAELAPKLKADFESVLPASLTAGEQSVADWLNQHAPAAWNEILVGAGPILTAFVQGVLARVALGTATTAGAAAAGAAAASA